MRRDIHRETGPLEACQTMSDALNKNLDEACREDVARGLGGDIQTDHGLEHPIAPYRRRVLLEYLSPVPHCRSGCHEQIFEK
jgi:hypothetical protein